MLGYWASEKVDYDTVIVPGLAAGIGRLGGTDESRKTHQYQPDGPTL